MKIAIFASLTIIFFLIFRHHSKRKDFIDVKLLGFFGGSDDMIVHSHSFPKYRFVDIFRAIEACFGTEPLLKLESSHNVKLHMILKHPENIGHTYGSSREVNQASRSIYAVDVEEEESFPADCYWVFFTKKHNVVVRLRENFVFDQVSGQNPVLLEIAGLDEDVMRTCKEEIHEWSLRHSIYRGKVLNVLFSAHVDEVYGHVQMPQALSLEFHRFSNVAPEEIILDPDVEQMLTHNVFDFHQHREVLQQLKLPLQRGLLLYGPPGTGKTYTCRYVISRMTALTTFLVSGDSLGHIDDICSLARLYQPSMIVMEDIDLMFSSREINLYSSALGDFMDQLDGLHKDDAVTFIMTTNAIERLEAAIKDRPGRVSQCIYMGPPSADLRRRYIEFFLSRYDDEMQQVDLDELTDLSKGCSQAYIKELVFRAVQFAAKDNGYAYDGMVIQDQHFVAAHKELTHNNSKQAQSIVGFKGPA